MLWCRAPLPFSLSSSTVERRNVINFRLGGDPRLLLRTINPGEAGLFDRASGVHVRFRLGGYSFPPSIYYKVCNAKVDCLGQNKEFYFMVGGKVG